MATPVQNKSATPPPAQPVAPPVVAPTTPVAQTAPAPAAPKPAANPPVAQPQTAAQPQTQPVPPQAAQPAKPTSTQKPSAKRFKFKLDWLFVLACFVVVCQIMLLLFLNNEKNEYNELKKEDTDRVFILQKASSVSQKDIDSLESAFLDEKEVISFIQTLEMSRNTFDEFILAFTSDVPQGKDVHYLPFTINATGSPDTVRSFMSKLLSSSYAIEAVTISYTVLPEDATKLTLSFVGNLYIQNGK